jgi:hypothetical protein
VSLLLKVVNAGRRTVLDPGHYPGWVFERYLAAGIEVVRQPAERFQPDCLWDEVWIMNALRHVADPQECVFVARLLARQVVRIADWIDEPLRDRSLEKAKLDEWCDTRGKVLRWRREDGVVQRLYVVTAQPLPSLKPA